MNLYKNRIVIKVGTSTLTNELGKSDLRIFDKLACVLSDIQNLGYEVILVTSGAIAVGRHKLGMKEQPSSMKLKQAREPKFSTRRYNRCKICGRPHAYLRNYGICRICFRELAYKGQIPGVRKASF